MSLSGWEIAVCVFRVISCSLPTCFISSPSYVSVIWFQMWSLSLPYLSILLYTIHTLSCYLKWRSNLKFNTPDFNIHKTETVEAGKVFLPCAKINPRSGFDLSINVKLMPFNLHCHVSWLWATVKHCRFCEALINIFRNGCIINIAIPNKNQVWSSQKYKIRIHLYVCSILKCNRIQFTREMLDSNSTMTKLRR